MRLFPLLFRIYVFTVINHSHEYSDMLSPVSPPSMSSNLSGVSLGNTEQSPRMVTGSLRNRQRKRHVMEELLDVYLIKCSDILPIYKITVHIKGSRMLKLTNTTPQNVFICISSITTSWLIFKLEVLFCFKMCASVFFSGFFLFFILTQGHFFHRF